MKRLLTSLAASTLVIAILVSWSVFGVVKGNNDNLSLIGTSTKPDYILGEPVRVNFEFVNSGGVVESIPSGDVETGSLRIYIAIGENGDYKEYNASSWGRARGRWLDLEPGQSYKSKEIVILWHGKPTIPIKAVDKQYPDMMTTEYAFQEHGVYFLKGRSSIKVSSNSGDAYIPIESKPIRIEIREPEGADKEVWERIKGNKMIAHLMQYGSFSASDRIEKQTVIARTEKILADYPESTYSAYLKPTLEKFKTDDVKREVILKTAKPRHE